MHEAGYETPGSKGSGLDLVPKARVDELETFLGQRITCVREKETFARELEQKDGDCREKADYKKELEPLTLIPRLLASPCEETRHPIAPSLRHQTHTLKSIHFKQSNATR